MNKYDLVRTHIDFIRQSIREISDDTEITDEQIYVALLEVRAMVMERRLEKGKEYPDSAYQTICLDLCVGSSSDCDPCFPDFGCPILQTVEIPASLFNGNEEVLRVSTIGGVEIAPTTDAKAPFRKYKKTGLHRYYYIKVNNVIKIYNVPQNRLKGIKLKTLSSDPAGLAMLSTCGASSCTGVLDAAFGTRASERIEMKAEVLKILGVTKQLPEDLSNNTESVIPNQII